MGFLYSIPAGQSNDQNFLGDENGFEFQDLGTVIRQPPYLTHPRIQFSSQLPNIPPKQQESRKP